MFRICVLYVDEDISVARQLERGRKIKEHNIQVRKSGQGKIMNERVTDNDVDVNSSCGNFSLFDRTHLILYHSLAEKDTLSTKIITTHYSNCQKHFHFASILWLYTFSIDS